MSQRFEYKFVRLAQTKQWFIGAILPSAEAQEEYQEVIQQHAREGWRLVQIFAPGLSMHGMSLYFELILERPVG
jgi:hypothetical protein